MSTQTPTKVVDLASVVAPLSAEAFLRDHWPERPYWAERGDGRLASVPELESAEAALAGARNVTFFKPDGSAGMVPDGDAALPLYRLGLTCYFAGSHIPALREGCEHLCADLGLPSGSIKAEIFCSDGESGVKMHSDFDVNFALLLRGHKRWRVAENHHIRNQTGVCRPGSVEQPQPLQLELADSTPFPDDMPEDAETLEMEAGSVLFLPRGWWHDTSASGECLQVNFVMKSPMWMAVLTRALKTRLMRDPGWRGYAFDVFSEDPERRDAALGELAELLAGLGDQLRPLLESEDRAALAQELLGESGFKPAERA
jgi:ribosomal protein L16 Arg81 hydroxylase